jgi:hypothetical protein
MDTVYETFKVPVEIPEEDLEEDEDDLWDRGMEAQ